MKAKIYELHEALDATMREIKDLDNYAHLEGAKDVQNMRLVQYAETLQLLIETISNHGGQ